LATVWAIATDGDHGVHKRELTEEALDVPMDVRLPAAPTPESEACRRAILDTVRAACSANLAEALEIQARHAAEFLASDACRRGQVGAEASRILDV
ncbi:MAG: hypothetical protein P8174_09940, partial [Gemmatimonadota bacterium]